MKTEFDDVHVRFAVALQPARVADREVSRDEVDAWARESGVRVFGDRRDNWVDTRRIWNQHAYCIENVEDDGAVPTLTPAYWDEHGTYRLNRLENLADITLAPDLIITDTNGNSTGCPITTRLRATVRNQGARGVPAGVPVAFYAGTPDAPGSLLGETRTSRTLLRDSEETVEVFIHDVPYDAELELQFFAMADDDGSGGPIVGIHSECLENNNAGEPITLECELPQ